MQVEIITALGVRSEIDPHQEIEQRSAFLAHHLASTGLKGFVLGVSGGQDSLLAGALAQKAVNIHRANGHEATFHAILLPYGNQADRDDALAARDFINPDFTHDLNIQPSVDAFAKSFQLAEQRPLSDFDKGNAKARIRMIAQYALASDKGLLVIGADHAAEAVTGFYTKFGDGGADILPLSGLTKRQGNALLQELGAPNQLVTKIPTADLLDSAPSQSDETELGIRYDEIDDYLEGKPISSRVAALIEDRYLASAHKRALPIGY